MRIHMAQAAVTLDNSGKQGYTKVILCLFIMYYTCDCGDCMRYPTLILIIPALISRCSNTIKLSHDSFPIVCPGHGHFVDERSDCQTMYSMIHFNAKLFIKCLSSWNIIKLYINYVNIGFREAIHCNSHLFVYHLSHITYQLISTAHLHTDTCRRIIKYIIPELPRVHA
jgi:hypothetical protein